MQTNLIALKYYFNNTNSQKQKAIINMTKKDKKPSTQWTLIAVIAGKAQVLLMTLTMALLHLSVPMRHLTASTIPGHPNAATYYVIYYTWAFPARNSQTVCLMLM